MCNDKGKIESWLKTLDKGNLIQKIVCSIRSDCEIGKEELAKTGLPPSKAYETLHKVAQEAGSNKKIDYNGTSAFVRESTRRSIYSLCRRLNYPVSS
jgi:hypothetical protein